jgi:ankyrin repeat protein
MNIACQNGNLEIVKYLLQNGAKNPKTLTTKEDDRILMNEKDKYETEIPLCTAARWNHLRVVQYLLDQEDYSVDI